MLSDKIAGRIINRVTEQYSNSIYQMKDMPIHHTQYHYFRKNNINNIHSFELQKK